MVSYRLLVAGAKQKWSKLGSFSPMAGAKQKLSKLGPFTSSAAIPSPPSAAKPRLPEFATVGLYSMFVGVCGGAGYAAYANGVDARNDRLMLDKKLIELDETVEKLLNRVKEMEKNEVQKTRPRPSELTSNTQMQQQLREERRRSEEQLLEAKQAEEENARKRMIALKEAKEAEHRRAKERIRRKREADEERRRSEEQLLEAKQAEEENARKRMIALKAAEKAEENRATETSQKLEANKSSSTKPLGKKAELLSESLRTLRRSCKDDDAKAKKAFETLHIYVRNVITNPDEEKYRRIRLANPAFQGRVASVRGGILFLELCGFEKTADGQSLYLPRDRVDMAVLNAAMRSLESALTNPFFGLLSVELPGNSPAV